MIAQQRSKHQHLLLLDGGHALYSDVWLTQQSKGALIIEAMNMMGYDAMLLAEGDLYLGVNTLGQRIKEADFHFVSANVRLAESGELFVQPYVILERVGLKIGIVGLTGEATELPGKIVVSDPLVAAQGVIPQVIEQADIVIVMSHLGWQQNLELAKMYPGVHLIVSGGLQTAGDLSYTDSVTGVAVAQAEYPTKGHAGRYIGRWKLDLGNPAQAKVSNWQLVTLGPEYSDDAAMLALIQRYAASQ